LFFRVEQRSPTIYLGGGQDFLSEIGLFRKLPGTELFASRVKSGSSIELGENVQLRSIVRSGDGKKKYFFISFFRNFTKPKWFCQIVVRNHLTLSRLCENSLEDFALHTDSEKDSAKDVSVAFDGNFSSYLISRR
jgi:hypothetical protein